MNVYTYKNQPTDNVDCWRLGEACRKAAEDKACGDYIDRGLILLRELQAKGYGIVRTTPEGIAFCNENLGHGDRCTKPAGHTSNCGYAL